MKKKGWVVWVWGKMGSLVVFMGMMLVLLTAYSFVGASAQADSANRFSATMRNLVTDTYNSAGGMSFEYGLPGDINGEDYSIEILDKAGDTVGIITTTKSGYRDVTGGASLSIPLSDTSFGILKAFDEELHYICIVKHEGMIYLEKGKCS